MKFTGASRLVILTVVLLLFGRHFLHAQQLPRIEGENLFGHQVILPDDASGTVAVLILGFSKASKTPTANWQKRIKSEVSAQPGLAVYQLPVLEDVPRLVRSMVISSMKSGVPESQRDRFIPLLHGEAELKKLVNFQAPDDAYLVVLDRSGKSPTRLTATRMNPAIPNFSNSFNCC